MPAGAEGSSSAAGPYTRHMSMKAVIVWLLLAVVLGVVVVVLVFMQPGGAKPSNIVPVGDRVLSFIPGEVEQIVVRPAGQPRQIVEKAPGAKGILGADADWQLRIEPVKAGEATLPPWPLVSAKLQSLLRVLSEMRAVALPAAGMELGQPTIVEIHLSGNRVITLSLAERTLAGTGLVEVDAPPAKVMRTLVNDQIHGVFTNPGPREWREPFPFGGIAPDASRIQIHGKGKPLVLGKVEGKWSVREPVQAPADPAAIQRLLANLGHISVADFLDDGVTGSTTGLDKPAGTITIEADRRSMPQGATEPKISTDTVTLAVGGAADSAVTRLFCSINGGRIVLLNSGAIRDIGTDASTVIWPHPLREAPADIGRIAITLAHPIPATTAEKTLRRSEGRWVQEIENNADVPLTSKDQLDVQALLLCLTGAEGGTPSSQPSTREPPAIPHPTISIEAPGGYRVLGTITVGSLAGQTIETLELGAAEKDIVVIRTGAVYRAYAAGQLPELVRAAVEASGVTPPSSSPPRTTP
jgi:hypothetical protein